MCIAESVHAALRAPCQRELLGALRRASRCRCLWLQADGISSSDDEPASGFDLPLSARKPVSTPTRVEQARASAEDFNVLGSFGLPEGALQDKVGYNYQLSSQVFLRLRSYLLLSVCSQMCSNDVLLPYVGLVHFQVIESYSCGLGNVHGRLYVTSKYALFSGWRNTKVSKPKADAKTFLSRWSGLALSILSNVRS